MHASDIRRAHEMVPLLMAQWKLYTAVGRYFRKVHEKAITRTTLESWKSEIQRRRWEKEFKNELRRQWIVYWKCGVGREVDMITRACVMHNSPIAQGRIGSSETEVNMLKRQIHGLEIQLTLLRCFQASRSYETTHPA